MFYQSPVRLYNHRRLQDGNSFGIMRPSPQFPLIFSVPILEKIRPKSEIVFSAAPGIHLTGTFTMDNSGRSEGAVLIRNEWMSIEMPTEDG